MLVIGSNSASTGYNLTRSLRTRASASANLTRTPATAGNQRTWTYSNWVKRGTLGATQNLFTVGTGSGLYFYLRFLSTDVLEVFTYDAGVGSYIWQLQTTQVFRDPSAWYHIVISTDTTQATAANRVKIYINGTQVTALAIATYPSLNYDTRYNVNVASYINSYVSSAYFDGYSAEFNSVDGQALTPSSFGSTNALTGVWQPARYTGTYGTNGFYLPFTDNSALTTSSNVGLGKDFSGNGNYWATNNISITAGTTYDSMTDVPTLTSATAANFAVLNPVIYYPNSTTIADGNLKMTGNSAGSHSISPCTMAMPSGKWYAEFKLNNVGSAFAVVGLLGTTENYATLAYLGQSATSYGYDSGGRKTNNASVTTGYGATFTTGDIIAIAFDATAGSLTFYKNNTSQGVAYTGISGTFLMGVDAYNAGSWSANFGQQPFTYTPPTGFVALNTYNLPTSTIVKGNTVMDATLWTGNSSTQSIVNAAAFKTDFVWIKNRTGANSHALFDSVRGATKRLYSDATLDEQTEATTLTAFNSNGFSLSSSGAVNLSANNYVGWQWQAGQGTTSSNTNGTITSTVSVNASAGFSVVTWAANGSANQTIGHGLGVAPSLVIVKHRNDVDNWAVWINGFSSSQFLRLNTTDSTATSAGFWNATPTSSVFSVGSTGTSINVSGGTYVAYCWTPIAGFSAFGSYTGNGSADGPFVYTGFRPKFIMIKRSDTAGNSWRIWDTARAPYNAGLPALYPNQSDAEDSITDVYDLVSNGFKLRTSAAGTNASSSTYIYMAFAESPFRNSLAR